MPNYSKILRNITRIYSLVPRVLTNGYAFRPAHLFFLVTYKCNLHCRICQWSQGDVLVPPKDGVDKKELNLGQIERLTGQVSKQALISFSGGEPFIREDMLDILKMASRRNRSHIVTNGTLLSAQDCRDLVGLGAVNLLGKGLILLEISVQGPDAPLHDRITDVAGSFVTALEAIKEIVRIKKSLGKAYPLINMKMVICKDNVNRLEEYFELAKSLGVDICNFMLQHNLIANLIHPGLEKDKICYSRPPKVDFKDIAMLGAQLDIVLRKNDKKMQVRFSPDIPFSQVLDYYLNKLNLSSYRCFSPWSRLYIHPYGDFSLCYYCDYPNAGLHDIKTVWNSGAFVSFRKRLKKEKIFPGCSGCCQLSFDDKIKNNGNHR